HGEAGVAAGRAKGRRLPEDGESAPEQTERDEERVLAAEQPVPDRFTRPDDALARQEEAHSVRTHEVILTDRSNGPLSGRGYDHRVERPVWLLDVDGVINAGSPGWGGAPRTGNAYSSGMEFRIRWAPPLVARIRALHDRGAAEIRWCSTWCCDADQLE